ncbi:hypothetical protein ACFOZ7_07050 [Natribaculum luteum]|uniref:Uncharacterized protein n=1 Tax=Natribaculum luteum TaxID=1586232 RepID=A0ABD5NYC7_9EURY|nr:hypothetical protein [Natribaculum luteum]
MDATADELAGVVDLFGGLTRDELERALSELAFRTDGQSVDGATVDDAIEDAIERFALVRYERIAPPAERSTAASLDEPLLVAGPTAFPSPPEHADDLPHILEIEPRSPDRGALGEQVFERFARAAIDALEEDDDERVRELLDVSYDIETWAPIDLADERARLDDELD